MHTHTPHTTPTTLIPQHTTHTSHCTPHTPTTPHIAQCILLSTVGGPYDLTSSRYSPQTSICVYRANDSDALVPNGNNNKGVFDIFRSLVYDPLSGKNIANAYVEVRVCVCVCVCVWVWVWVGGWVCAEIIYILSWFVCVCMCVCVTCHHCSFYFSSVLIMAGQIRTPRGSTWYNQYSNTLLTPWLC